MEHKNVVAKSLGAHGWWLICNAIGMLFLLNLNAPPLSSAADFAGSLNRVAITDQAGTNNPPTAVINYSQNADSFAFDASGSADSDGSIVEYKWDFGDNSSGAGVTASHSYIDDGTYQVTLSVLDNNGGVTLTKVTLVKSPTISKAINFQPGGVTVPSGYLPDNGFTYEDNRGYGWNAYMPNSRDRNSASSPDQAYDTNIIYILATDIWEISLPNGKYDVTICSGDATQATGNQKIQAEGIAVIDGEISSTKKWIESTKTVTVADGRLTVTFTGTAGSIGGAICWIKIVSK